MLTDIKTIEKLTGLKKTSDNMRVTEADGLVTIQIPREEFVKVTDKAGVSKLVYRTENTKIAQMSASTNVVKLGNDKVNAKQVKFELAYVDENYWIAKAPSIVAKKIRSMKSEMSKWNVDQLTEFIKGQRSVDNYFQDHDLCSKARFITDPRNKESEKLTLLEWANLSLAGKVEKANEAERRESARNLASNPMAAALIQALLEGRSDKEIAAIKASYQAEMDKISVAREKAAAARKAK